MASYSRTLSAVTRRFSRPSKSHAAHRTTSHLITPDLPLARRNYRNQNGESSPRKAIISPGPCAPLIILYRKKKIDLSARNTSHDGMMDWVSLKRRHYRCYCFFGLGTTMEIGKLDLPHVKLNECMSPINMKAKLLDFFFKSLNSFFVQVRSIARALFVENTISCRVLPLM
jgi:hypothetical protein